MFQMKDSFRVQDSFPISETKNLSVFVVAAATAALSHQNPSSHPVSSVILSYYII